MFLKELMYIKEAASRIKDLLRKSKQATEITLGVKPIIASQLLFIIIEYLVVYIIIGHIILSFGF